MKAVRPAVRTTLFLFCIANVYHLGVVKYLFYAKFAALILLFVIMASARLRSTPPGDQVVSLTLLILLALGSLSLLNEYTTLGNALRAVGMVVVVVSARRLASVWSSARWRAVFLSELLLLCRVVAWVSLGMLVVGLNLGRARPRFSGWTDNPNMLGMMLFIMVPVVLSRALHRPSPGLRSEWILLGVIGVLLAATGSRAAILGALVGGVVLLWATGRVRARFMLVGAIAIGAAVVLWDDIADAVVDVPGLNRVFQRDLVATVPGRRGPSAAFSGREEVWALSMHLCRERPWLGYGWGNEADVLGPYLEFLRGHQGESAHNSYISLTLELGVLGLALFLILLLRALLRSVRVQLAAIRRARTVDDAQAVFLSIFVASVCHAFFESWLFATGNVNSMVFWPVVFFLAEGVFTRDSRSRARTRQPWARSPLTVPSADNRGDTLSRPADA